MSDLSHIEIDVPEFNPRTGSDDFEMGVPNLRSRNPERPGKPRAARFDFLDARLYAIGRAAVVDWKEGR